MSSCSEITRKLQDVLKESGLECHPFKVGWYNSHVKPGFCLEHHDDTLAFTIISSPSFFEKCFIPFVCQSTGHNDKYDFLDQCLSICLENAIQLFPDYCISILKDYEMKPGTRRPKVLVQTAGHVSGAAYFYQKSDVSDPPWPHNQTIHGVCLHPNYIGWFALRAVIIFHEILVPELPFRKPRDVLNKDRAKIIDLLNRYNNCWQDWSFRDILEPVERYSELQKQYFKTRPAERIKLIEIIKKNSLKCN